MIPRDPAAASAPPPQVPMRTGGRGRKIVRFALFFLTVVVLVDAVVGENGVLALLHARRTYAAVERALQQAKEDNAGLRETARRLREDPAAIEAIARRDLLLIKPGEKVFIIKDAAPRQ